MYVSIQDKSEVIRYCLWDGQPAPFPPAIMNSERPESVQFFESLASSGWTTEKSVSSKSHLKLQELKRQKKRFISKSDTGLDPGSFVMFPKTSRIRDVEAAQGRLLVADEDAGVASFDQDGYANGFIHVDTPVSLYYSELTDSLWVSSRRTHALQEFDMKTSFLIKTVRHKYLKHPTGITGNPETMELFVISQQSNSILVFDMISGKYKKTLLNNLKDGGERILLSPC